MARRLPLRSELLELLAKDDRALHAREIAERSSVAEESYDALLRMLDDMVFEGVIAPRPGQRFRLPKEKKTREEREGTISVNARGFAFVTAPGATDDDVFVPAEAIGGAMHGDRVRVRLVARGSRGAEGVVVEVLGRGAERVSGVLRRRGRSAWVEPDDTRVRGPITLPDDIDASGPEGNSGNDGDAVIVRIVRHPALADEAPVGKLEAVLGRPGTLSVEVAKILAIGAVAELHTEQAVAEAESYGSEVAEALLDGREDLTELPLPTIDPSDARDHDDAIWVERSDTGGYVAWVAIADVSTYVRPGMQLDVEAKARGCSVYLPDRGIAMLPRALSSKLCSLLPDVLRLCVAVEAHIDASGAVRRTRVLRGFMRSQAMLTYEDVARVLGHSPGTPTEQAKALREGLVVAHEVTRKLRARRIKRGALDFELPEPKVVLDATSGEPIDVERRAKDPGMKRAYELVEELMLLANEAVAQWLVERSAGAIFRVHLPPDATKMERFARLADELGIPFDEDALVDPRALATLLRSYADHPLASVLNMLLLRSMKQASYDVDNLGHFGLASTAYLHFTSPIRRYPDLVVHRVVHRLLGGKAKGPDESREALAEAALASSQAERRAMEVERDVVDLYRAFVMNDRVGEQFEGSVTGLSASAVYVALDAPYVDVLVRLEDLGGEGYEVDEDGVRAVASRSGDAVMLGDRVTIEVVSVSIERHTVFGRRVVEQRATRRERRGNKGLKKGARKGEAPQADAHPRGKGERRGRR